jgi:stage II sporulation protein AA (anti-sigma F factor antagonist)
MAQTDFPSLTSDGNVLIVTCPKEFDAVAVANIRPQLMDVIAKGVEDIVFDFSNVEFVDSSGIGVCVFCYKRLNPKGKHVAIVGAKEQPMSMIKLSQIGRAVSIHDDLGAFTSEAKV